jgi:hypothetical protein
LSNEKRLFPKFSLDAIRELFFDGLLKRDFALGFPDFFGDEAKRDFPIAPARRGDNGDVEIELVSRGILVINLATSLDVVSNLSDSYSAEEIKLCEAVNVGAQQSQQQLTSFCHISILSRNAWRVRIEFTHVFIIPLSFIGSSLTESCSFTQKF